MAPNAVAPPNGLLIQRTDNNGAVWQPQVNGTGVINGFDKDMIAADDVATSPFANNLYCTWTVFGGATTVQFNRSTNGGNAFTAPIILKNGFGQGANVQTGPNGEVYVCWADYTNGAIPAQGLGFTRSLNGGVTFTPFAIPFNYAGIRIGNGANANFNNTRVNDFLSMAVDKSNSPRRGRIYVVYAERENGNGKSIVRLRWSDNQGTNWSAPTTLSIATARQSWMPWIAVDNTTGNVFVSYFCMENQNNFNTNTFVAASVNGFATFQNRIVSDVAHVTAPIPQFQNGYAGDYIGITANGGRGFAAWMDDRNGTWQNYVSEVRTADIELTGNAQLCTGSNTYTLTGLPAGVVINWQPITPSGIVNFASNNNTATLTRNGNASGIITLIAEVIDGGCNYGLFSIQVTVGNPDPPMGTTYVTSNYYYLSQTQITTPLFWFMPAGQTGYVTYVITDPTVTPQSWSTISGNTPIISADKRTLYFSINTGQTASYQMTAIGVCGTYTKNFGATVLQGGGFSIVPSPNPASESLRVNITDESSEVKALSTEENIIMSLYHFNTTVIVKEWHFKNNQKQFSLNVSDLKKGQYILVVTKGKFKQSQQIIIEK